MKTISIQQALTWLSHATLKTTGTQVSIDLNKTAYGVNTDTRTLRSGNLFVALKGDRFDGHRFIGFATRSQASVAIVNSNSEELDKLPQPCIPLICVPDTGKALLDLAQGYRQQFNIPLAVVVGSNGKTTVKEMIHSVFKTHLGLNAYSNSAANQNGERAAHCTIGNFNNDIGLPLTLLRLNDYHKLSVIELGMNHPGETAQLARVAAPTIAIINNAQREHQEFMHTVEAVANEHASVMQGLHNKGVVIIPAQDVYAPLWREYAQGLNKQLTIIDFALHTEIDTTPAIVTGRVINKDDKALNTINHINDLNLKNAIQILEITTPQGTVYAGLNIAGEHHARNALATTAAGLAAHIPLSHIVAGLGSFEPVKGRMQEHSVTLNTGKTIRLIDDTYNANPDSVAAAIKVLAGYANTSKRTVLVLGDMGEVGEQGPQFHAEAGLNAAQHGVSALYTIGELSQHAYTAYKTSKHASGKPVIHSKDSTTLQDILLSDVLNDGDTVLIKGSRFMRMEFIVEALLGKKTAFTRASTSKNNPRETPETINTNTLTLAGEH